MKNIVSLIVVTVFLVILFRKRVVPFLKTMKNHSGKQAAIAALPDVPDRVVNETCYCVLAFDVTKYGNMDLLGEVISTKLEREIVNAGKKGHVIGVDAVPMSRILLFLIRWNPA